METELQKLLQQSEKKLSDDIANGQADDAEHKEARDVEDALLAAGIKDETSPLSGAQKEFLGEYLSFAMSAFKQDTHLTSNEDIKTLFNEKGTQFAGIDVNPTKANYLIFADNTGNIYAVDEKSGKLDSQKSIDSEMNYVIESCKIKFADDIAADNHKEATDIFLTADCIRKRLPEALFNEAFDKYIDAIRGDLMNDPHMALVAKLLSDRDSEILGVKKAPDSNDLCLIVKDGTGKEHIINEATGEEIPASTPSPKPSPAPTSTGPYA